MQNLHEDSKTKSTCHITLKHQHSCGLLIIIFKMLQPKKAYHQPGYLITNAPVTCLLGTDEAQEPPLNQTLTLPRLPCQNIAKPRAHPTCRPGGATPMLTSNTSSHPWHCVQDVGMPFVAPSSRSYCMVTKNDVPIYLHAYKPWYYSSHMIPMAVRTAVSWRRITSALFLFALVSNPFHTSVFVT